MLAEFAVVKAYMVAEDRGFLLSMLDMKDRLEGTGGDNTAFELDMVRIAGRADEGAAENREGLAFEECIGCLGKQIENLINFEDFDEYRSWPQAGSSVVRLGCAFLAQ